MFISRPGRVWRRRSPQNILNVISHNSIAQNCDAPFAGGEKETWRQHPKGLGVYSEKYNMMLGEDGGEKLLREGHDCVFGGQFAHISMSWVTSKTPSCFNNTLNCPHIHRGSRCTPI